LYSFSNKERWALAGMILLLVPALLVNLGLVPLYVEEPRRAAVALEMLLRDNWLVPTINGEYYYLKPPFFNWILAVVYQLAGSTSEFVTRIPTVTSLLLLGLVIFWSGKKYVSFSFGALSAMLFVTASGNLFFNALLAEIDIFYSLVTYTSLISLFHFHQRKKYLLLFLTIYFLGAIGLLTKGLPSLVFTGLSILVFFLVKKEFKRLFTWSHLAGIILFLLITTGYFVVYSNHGDAVRYLLSLSVESGKRLSGDTFWDYLKHMILYPLDTLMNLLPSSLLIIFSLRKSFLKDIRGNSFMRFVLLMLFVHFPVYWLPPGGRQRYIIMLYPFIIQVFTYFYLIYFETDKGKHRLWSGTIAVAIAVGAIGCLVPLFIDTLDFIPGLLPICLAAFILMAAVLAFQYKNPSYSIFSLLFAVLILRLVFGFTVLPVRATEGAAPANKNIASEIGVIVKDREVCILQPTYLPMQTIFYFEKERREILPVCRQVEPGRFYIVEKTMLKDYSFRREINTLLINPLRPLSDPFSGDDKVKLSGYDYQVHLDFKLQKRSYLLLMPKTN
jgi:4-amino-4-deoxy-L-arabinose transferase-like glycosyltransferase